MLMFQKGTCLGVDISDSEIKIVEMRKGHDKYEVVQAARLKVGCGDFATALQQFMAETGTSPSKVVWSLPTNACSIKFAELPSTKPVETARMARYEAEAQIPLPLSDLVWGYSAGKPAKGEMLSHVTIAGVRRALVEGTACELVSAGLNPFAATVASLAEVRGLQRTLRHYDEPVFVVNIGNEWTDLTALSDGRVISCRSVPIGIAQLISEVAADRNIDIEEAFESITQRPITCDWDTSGMQAVINWLESLSLEIRRSALSAMSGIDAKPLKTAILTGDATAIPGLSEALAGKTNMSVEIADPWSEMSLSTVVAHTSQDHPAVFAVATGLAKIGLDGGDFIDLMPGYQIGEHNRRRKDASVIVALGATALILLIILLSGYSGIRAKNEELDNLKMSVAEAKKHAVYVPAQLSTSAATMEKVVKDLRSRDDKPIEILQQLSVGLPKSCWLTEFRYETGKSVVLKGKALSNSSVADTVYLMSNADKYGPVSLDYSNLGRDAGAQNYDFQIKCQLPQHTSLAQLSLKSKSTTERTIVQ